MLSSMIYVKKAFEGSLIAFVYLRNCELLLCYPSLLGMSIFSERDLFLREHEVGLESRRNVWKKDELRKRNANRDDCVDDH